MSRFPIYRPQFQYYRPYNYRYHTPIIETPATPHPPRSQPETPKSEIAYSQSQKQDTPVWFELFGIKLYFDDVLILSLLFFLYKEEVKDEGLFLALVLLLIS